MATVTKPIIKDETGQEIISAIQGLKDTIMTNDSSLADPFSTSVSYAVGDYCIYESTLYKCVVAHTGAWNDTHFIVTKAMDEVESINEKIGDVIDEDTTPTIISYTPTIAVDNALGVNAEDVKVKIEPVQAGSGTPSPTNIRPITGWDEVKVERCGKNLIDVADTSYSSSNYIFEKTINLAPAGTYTFSMDLKIASGKACAIELINDSSIVAGTTKITTTNISGGLYYLKITSSSPFNKVRVYANAAYEAKQIQFELGSTPTTFEPYQGNIYTIDLNGTRYGGTLDVTSGELTVTHGYADLGDLTWEYEASRSRFVTTTLNSLIKKPSSDYEVVNAISSMYEAGPFDTVYTNRLNGKFACSSGANLTFINLNYTDAAQFKTAMAGQTFVYELATPQTIQLTPAQIKMLQGNNTLFADSGDTQLEYFGKTIGGIEGAIDGISEDVEELRKMKVAITALGDDESGRTIASRAYVTGEYFYQDGKMYKVLTSIASGATFTVGTNCSQTTIFEELKALAQ